MKLSCLPVSYFRSIIEGRRTIDSWIEEAAGLGLEGIDLSILFFREGSTNRPDQIKQRITDSGLQLVMLNTYSDLTHPQAAVREEQTVQLERDVETAAALGAAYVRIVSGQDHPGTPVDEAVGWAVSGFRRAAAVADRAGIGLVYENHSKPGNWSYPDFSMNPDHFLRIAEQLQDTSIRILFDTANPLVFGAEPLPLLERVIDRVACVHAADTSVRGTLKPVVIGTGLVPFPELFAFLKRSSFGGWVSIEEASGTGRQGVSSAVRFVRDSWEKA